MVSLSDVRVAFEEGGNLMIGVVGNTKHTDGGGCLNLESEGGREGGSHVSSGGAPTSAGTSMFIM